MAFQDENAAQAKDNTDDDAKSKPDEEDSENSERSISEHITSTSASVENDRSFQEIEIFNSSAFVSVSEGHISHEPKPTSLDLSSFGSNITNGLLDNMDNVPKKLDSLSREGTKNAKSILEEILTNTQFHSDIDNTISKEESFNLFANLDLSDKSLINVPSNNNTSLNAREFATFDLPLDVDDDKSLPKSNGTADNRLKQLEEIVAVKESTINALNQELDSFREMSNPTYTSSMISATEYRQLQEDCHIKVQMF